MSVVFGGASRTSLDRVTWREAAPLILRRIRESDYCGTEREMMKYPLGTANGDAGEFFAAYKIPKELGCAFANLVVARRFLGGVRTQVAS